MLELKRVSAGYGSFQALFDVVPYAAGIASGPVSARRPSRRIQTVPALPSSSRETSRTAGSAPPTCTAASQLCGVGSA